MKKSVDLLTITESVLLKTKNEDGTLGIKNGGFLGKIH